MTESNRSFKQRNWNRRESSEWWVEGRLAKRRMIPSIYGSETSRHSCRRERLYTDTLYVVCGDWPAPTQYPKWTIKYSLQTPHSCSNIFRQVWFHQWGDSAAILLSDTTSPCRSLQHLHSPSPFFPASFVSLDNLYYFSVYLSRFGDNESVVAVHEPWWIHCLFIRSTLAIMYGNLLGYYVQL